MASSGNPITPGGGPFDMQALFNPSSPQNPASIAPQTANPNPQIFPNSNTSANPNLVPYPPPSASYPPPTGGGPYTFTPQNASPYHFQPVYQPYPNQEFVNVHPQRSLSIPAPTLQPQMQQIPSSSYNLQNPPNPQNPNHGAQLMAMLNGQPAALVEGSQQAINMPQIHPTSSAGSDFAVPQNSHMTPSGGLMGAHQGAMMRMQSSKLPKGRHLIGDHLVYDIDDRFPGEMQPQLEVTPITKYGSDPGLVVGRQIAVNKTYICYGLKLGAVRVLNINTALRSLLKGLAQRVTDMVFFAEDVHLLASASVDGRVYVWKITEGPDEEDKPQITGNVVIAIQITGEGEDVHPRVCWHCHKQEVLVVGIGKRVLKIDTTKVGKRERFSAEEPLQCPIDKLVDGIQLVGSHDGEITDLSMCQWMTTRLVSASVDGTIKIWEDRNSQPIAVLRPHDGHPVNSATFLAAPHRPDHIILITGGPLNREIKIWVSASEEGWLLPSDAESWNCTQTLQLKSSEARFEDAFFNQVMALSQSGLLVLANAKRNAIYGIHFNYGPNPAATRMDYLAEFTVTMPILSLTGTSVPLPHGDQTIQMYCVQTQAIQQYALDLSRCLPPPIENAVLQKSDSSISLGVASERLPNVEPPVVKPMETFPSTSAPKASVHESSLGNKASGPPPTRDSSSVVGKLVPLSTSSKESDASVTSPPLQSPRVARTLSGYKSPLSSFGSGLSVNDNNAEPIIVEYSVDRQIDAIHGNSSDGYDDNKLSSASLDDSSRNDDNKLSQDDNVMGLNSPIKFKHPTHLVTPSEILMANSTSDIHVNDSKSEGELSIQDVAVSNDTRTAVVDLQIVGESRFSQPPEELPTSVLESKEKSFYSQASDLGMDMAQEFRSLSPETFVVEDIRQQFDVNGVSDKYAEPSTVEEVHDSTSVPPSKILESSTPVLVQQQSTPNVKGKKQKGKSGHGAGLSSASASVSYSEQGTSSSTPVEHAFSQISSMQEMLSQLVTNQKQMETVFAASITKEVKRIEAAMGRSVERTVKANSDALWARIQEDNVRREKAAKEQAAKEQAQLLANIINAGKEQTQQLSNVMNNILNKDFPSVIERTLKKELSSMVQSIARTLTPSLDKTVSTSITDNFQKGLTDKAVNQLEKSVLSRIEATVTRQIHVQFQTSGKQALQESLKSSFEAFALPAFEKSCRAMFEQVDAAFQKGMGEHTSAAQKQLDASLLPTALALRDAINSASSMTQTLSSEMLDGQRKVLALFAGANSQVANPLISQLSNGPLGALHEKVEVPVDPTKELSRLVAERKYEEAFTSALQRSDVGIVSWLCYQVDLPGLLSMNPLPLSQGVLLSLLQQLACDISTETSRKLTWMREVVSAINPTDPMIVVHVRPIFEQVYQILNHHRNLPTTSGAELSTIRLITHVLNSMLMGSK